MVRQSSMRYLMAWAAVKRTIRYLKRTISAKLEYSRDGNHEMIGYCDADWASDNTSAIDLSKSTGYHARTKHIDIRHHFVRQRISYGQVEIQHVGTERMIADVLTKSLFKPKHLEFANGLGLRFDLD